MMDEAKAWCFDNGITQSFIEECWKNALDKKVPAIVNFHKQGIEWWALSPRLLQQLVERYGPAS